MAPRDRRGASQVLSPDRRRAFFCLLLLLLPAPGGGLEVQHKFVSATDTNNFALDRSGSKIYLAAVNRLYQLSGPNLTLEVEEQVGPREDNPLCHAPQLPQASCEHAKKPTDNYNKLLQPDPEQGILVVCGSVYQGFCQLRSMDNISVVAVAFPPRAGGGEDGEQVTVFPSMLNVAANHANASTVGLVLQQPGQDPRLLVAATYTGLGSPFFPRNQSLEDHRFENTPEIAIRALNARGDLARLFTFDINPSDDNIFKIKQGSKERHRLSFVHAFLHRGTQQQSPAAAAPRPGREKGAPGGRGSKGAHPPQGSPVLPSPLSRPGGSYAYLALNSEANAREKESHSQSLLARICLGDSAEAAILNGSSGGGPNGETKKLTESYIQMSLQCGGKAGSGGTKAGAAGGDLFNRLVSVFPASAALQVSAGSPSPPLVEELLFGVFEKAVSPAGFPGRQAPPRSALCVFRFAEIEEAIRKARHSCFVEPDSGLVTVLDSVVQGTGPACEKRNIQLHVPLQPISAAVLIFTETELLISAKALGAYPLSELVLQFLSAFKWGLKGRSCKEPTLGTEVLEGALERAKSCLKEPVRVPEGCKVAELLSARQPRASCEAKWCYHQQQQLLEVRGDKPRIWSLAHTATSLHQAEYPSCMLKHQQGVPSAASALTLPAVEQPTKDSLVTNLSN
ncbi:UNVERIFIED_CONTAM: hypothetical protein K2H54_054029 [Gekko kuhli]